MNYTLTAVRVKDYPNLKPVTLVYDKIYAVLRDAEYPNRYLDYFEWWFWYSYSGYESYIYAAQMVGYYPEHIGAKKTVFPAW